MGLPIQVMAEDGEVTMTLEPTVSPYILMLDKRGVVVCEGQPDDADFWDVLAAAEN